MASKQTQASATGDVTTDSRTVKSVVLTAGSDAASVVVKAGGASGTTQLTLKAAANTTAVWSTGAGEGVGYADGIHVTLTGTGPVVNVEYE